MKGKFLCVIKGMCFVQLSIDNLLLLGWNSVLIIVDPG